jgi:aspartyl aminopeptidase
MVSIYDLSENLLEFRGSQPATEKLTKEKKKFVREKFCEKYRQFLEERLTQEAVNKIQEYSQERNFEIGTFSKKPFFITDEQAGINGAIGNAFAIARLGKTDSPLRIILAHTDVPCLKITPQPIYINADAIKEKSCSNIYLSTEPRGGIRQEDWYGQAVDIMGYVHECNSRKKVIFPGVIKQKSLHVDTEEYRRLKQ